MTSELQEIHPNSFNVNPKSKPPLKIVCFQPETGRFFQSE